MNTMKQFFNSTNTEGYRKLLSERFPQIDQDRLFEEAEKILTRIKAEHAGLSSLERLHTDNKIFPCIALYKALQDVMAKEEALRIMGDATLIKASASGDMFRKKLRTRRASGMFVTMFSKIADIIFGEKAGFEVKHYKTEKYDARFDMLACPYHRWFTEYGCGELCQFACKSDEYAYGNLDHIVFERSETLGTGGSRCDFHVYLKKEQEKPLTVHEFGIENEKTIVLFHPLAVRWDIFDRVIPELEKDYHLIIPAIPGHDPDQPESEFTSVETIVTQITQWLIENGHEKVTCLYGCSMGGSLVIRMISEGIIQPKCAVIDAGITPYELPKPLTYAIGAKDWTMIETGKLLSLKALRSVMDPDLISEEDAAYLSETLKHMSAKTAWNGFYSCNNYSMPGRISQPSYPAVYWYGEKEKKARKKDLRFVKKIFPSVTFREQKGQDHAESFTYHPEMFVKDLKAFIEKAESEKQS